jgi:3-dehydroquinate dehydratase-2
VHLLVIQGPNVDRIGRRGAVYGTVTLDEVRERLDAAAAQRGSTLEHLVSNSQGALIDGIFARPTPEAVIINPGGLTNVGIALRDAVEDLNVPVAVVHVTNAARRESWRRQDVFADIATVYIAGAGALGYELALQALHAPER